ncbi:MAG: hypothetical protein NTX13_05630, partial [Acidobacteria bacterium]|nr:hypothetical protein [Acidobacteriota bacterium]
HRRQFRQGRFRSRGIPFLSACYRVVNFSLVGAVNFSLAPKQNRIRPQKDGLRDEVSVAMASW